MIIPIRYSVKYKNYPYAPKATKKSIVLGYLTSVPMLAIYGLFWAGIVFGLLGSSDAAMIAALISLVPFYIVVSKLKNKRSAKIDEMAKLEIYQNMMKNQQ